MNWNKLSEEIFVAARLSFSELISRHNEEHFYAFALYTDSDCYTVVPAANSLQKYDTKIAEDNVDDETEWWLINGQLQSGHMRHVGVIISKEFAIY